LIWIFLQLALCTENSSGLRLKVGNERAILAPKSTNHELMIRQLDLLPASAKLRGYAFGVHQAHHKVSSQVRVPNFSRLDLG
jgi:hypothetical protein